MAAESRDDRDLAALRYMGSARETVMNVNDNQERVLPSLFIKGYLTDCFAKGDRPVYGFPKNHLPETNDDEVHVVTGFLADCDSN